MKRTPAMLVVLGLVGAAWGQSWGPTVVSRDPTNPNARPPAMTVTHVQIETRVQASLAETRTTLPSPEKLTATASATLARTRRPS